jgi:hypothetical protein
LELDKATIPKLLNDSYCKVKGRLIFRAFTLFRMMAEVLARGLSKETGTYVNIDNRHEIGHFELLGKKLFKLLCAALKDEYPAQLVMSPD